MRTLLEDLVDLYGPIADSKSIAITTLIDSDSAEIYVDRDAVAQALANLLDNALKYTPQGGEILIEGKFQSGESEIAVTDNGPGIAPEHHKDVLKRFFRLDDASRTTPRERVGFEPGRSGCTHAQAGPCIRKCQSRTGCQAEKIHSCSTQ